MKSILTLVLLFLLNFSALSADVVNASVAKVDYGEIDELLTKVVLNVEGNEALRDRFYAKQQAAKETQEKMQAALMRGEGINPHEAALGFMHADIDQKQVEQLCQKYLLEIIERVFEDKYDLVFKDDYRSSLLYTRSAIDDVTMIIKQELLRELPQH